MSQHKTAAKVNSYLMTTKRSKIKLDSADLKNLEQAEFAKNVFLDDWLRNVKTKHCCQCLC